MLLWTAACTGGQEPGGATLASPPPATTETTPPTGSGSGSGPGTGSGTGPGPGTGTTGTGSTGTGTEPPPDLVLLTLNLHCLLLDGTDYATNEARMGAIAAWAAGAGVDVLLLQEACDDGATSAMGLLEAALEAETGRDWSGAWAFAHRAWEGTPDEADEGVGILAAGPLAEEASSTFFVQGGLQRVALRARLPAELGGLVVTSLHLEVDDASVRAVQARQAAVEALVATEPALDAIVGGDLNDVEGSAAWSAFTDLGFEGLSAGLDPAGIDHLFAHRAAGLLLREARVVLDGVDGPVVSDHPGVLAALDRGAPVPAVLTGVTAHVDVGWGHWLALRGDLAPLSWDAGWPMANLDAATWRIVLPDLPGKGFACKTLVDDLTWQEGHDVAATVGTENEIWPTFPAR